MRRIRKGSIGRWLISCLFVFASACTQAPAHSRLKLTMQDSVSIAEQNERAFDAIAKAKPLIRQGYLILRTGSDFTSESLRQLSQLDKTYSHCGVASIENDTVFVYHALGGEWNPDEKLRRDPLEIFCSPYENRGFGIFTYNLNDKATRKLDSVVKSWYNKGYTFDMDFDLSTDEKLYCAEFVSKAIHKATDTDITFGLTTINNFTYVAVDNLFKNKYCSEILRVRYR